MVNASVKGLCVGLFSCAIVWCAIGEGNPVAVGENILNNPDLQASEGGFPLNWIGSEMDKKYLKILEEDGVRFARMSFGAGECECNLKQSDIRLVPGARYRVGAWVRTKDLQASQFGLIVCNWGWSKSDGPTVPKDTAGKWVWLEKEFEAPKSSFNAYSFYAYTINQHAGTMDVRGPVLEALDEAGAKDVVRSLKIDEYNRITPIGPLLEDIPAGDSEFLFAYFTRKEGLICRVHTRLGDGRERFQGDFPVVKNRIRAKLTEMTAGAKGEIRATIRQGDVVLASKTYKIAVRADVPLTYAPPKRLNNAVSHLLTVPAEDCETGFSMPQDGWVRINIDKQGRNTRVWMDGAEDPVVFTRPNERLETMRYVRRGDHGLKVGGAVGGKLTVNAIPMLYCWAYPGANKWTENYKPYRNSFITNYLFASFNTFVWPFGPGVSEEEWKDFYRRGKQRIGHAIVWNEHYDGFNFDYETAEHLAGRLRDYASVTNAKKTVGYVYDEVFMSFFKSKWIYADAMRLLQDADNPCCTWSSGYHFPYTALDAEYLSACLNASHGKGRFFFEVYPRFVSTDLAKAEAHACELIDETAARAKRLVPGFARSALFAMAMYTGIGRFCYDNSCDSDPKWMQDRYLRKLATVRDLDGLGGFGLYCYGDGEEEDVRWVCDAVRHYLLEGNTKSFAAMNGIELDPRAVRNGTFVRGLADWKVDGEIRPETVKGYAKRVHQRRFCVSSGNEVAVFKRRSEGPNRLSQTLTNLDPGRLYSVRYAVSPLAEIVEGGKEGPVRRYGIDARVEGADDVTESMPIREYGGAERNTPRLNARTIVFRACAKTANLVFTDWQSATESGGETGEELALSVVRVRPYYTGNRSAR